MRRFLPVCLFLLLPSVLKAQEAPERILPSGCQIFLQWDGFEKHRADFDKTGLGKMMSGDTGKFLAYLVTYTRKNIEIGTRGGPEGKQILAVFDEVVDTFGKIGKHGFALGLEVKSIMPPNVEATIVFPENGKTLLSLMDKILKESREKPKVTQIGKEKIFAFSAPGDVVHFGWFQHAGHGVLTFGTQPPFTIAKRASDGDAGVTKNDLFKKVAATKGLKTWARGYLDLASAWELVGGIAPEANQIITDLGLNGLHHITFVSGFEGEAERGIVEIKTAKERKGLLALLNRKTIKLADLPPLPDDVRSFSASNFTLGNLYEGFVQIGSVVAKVATRGDVDARELIKQFEGVIGVKLKDDIFDNFDGMFVGYSSPSEGPLGLGAVTMLKVKDEKKLQQGIESLVKGIQLPIPGFEIKLNAKEFRGVKFHELVIRVEQEIPLFTYTIHKGWFALASYPQPLYGYILRADGKLPVWKASKDLTKRLEAFPKDFTGISVSDPRPTVEFVLSVVPGITSIVNQILPSARLDLIPFDTSVIPHAREAARHLFPNISVTTDDGSVIRIDGRYSLALPF